MHDLPRQKLHELFQDHGADLCNDPRRCCVTPAERSGIQLWLAPSSRISLLQQAGLQATQPYYIQLLFTGDSR